HFTIEFVIARPGHQVVLGGGGFKFEPGIAHRNAQGFRLGASGHNTPVIIRQHLVASLLPVTSVQSYDPVGMLKERTMWLPHLPQRGRSGDFIKSVQACPRSHSVATKIRAPPLIGPDGGRTLESLSAHPICSRRLSSTISSSMRFSIPLTCLTHAFQRALDTHAISGLFSISFCLAVMERHGVMQRRKTTGPTSCGVVRILTGHKSASQHGTVKLQR